MAGLGQRPPVQDRRGHSEKPAVDHPEDDSGPQLLEDDTPDLAHIDPPCGQPADDDGRGLGAEVSSHAEDHRDEARKHDASGKHAAAREGVHHPGHRQPPDEGREEPRQAGANGSGRRQRQPLLVGSPCHLVEVLGRLFPGDIDHVVDRDDAHQLVMVVHHRNGQQVILGGDPRHFLLVGVRPHSDHVGGHDFLQPNLRVVQQQLPQRQDSDKVVAVVHDIEVEDHFGLLVLLERPDRILHQCVLVQGEDVGSHDPAGRFLRIHQQLLDLGGLLPLHQREQPLAEFRGQLGDELGGVVGGKLLEDARRRLGWQSREQLGGLDRVDLADDPRGQRRGLLGQDGDQPDPLLLRQVLEHRRDVRRPDFLQQVHQVSGGPAPL